MTRVMTLSDAMTCSLIEERSSPKPMTHDYLMKCISSGNSVGYVAELDNVIVGHVIVLFKEDSIEILSLTVDEAFRRLSIGTWLIKVVLDRLDDEYKKVVVRVPDSNLVAHIFLRDLGFMVNEIVKSKKRHGDDVYVFEQYYVKDSMDGNGNNNGG